MLARGIGGKGREGRYAALLDELGLDFSRGKDVWGYEPDPTRADRVEVIAFSADRA